MARLLLQFDEVVDVETLTPADAEAIAKEAGLDVGKIEKLKVEWGQPWTLDLVEQALSGSMFVAGVWRQPTMIEAEQQEAAAQAAREAWQRAVRYAVALRRSAENAVITRAYKADPAKFLADREARRSKLAAPAPETALPGASPENSTSDTPRRETTPGGLGGQFPPRFPRDGQFDADPEGDGQVAGSGDALVAARSLPREQRPAPGTPPDVASNIDRGPEAAELTKMDGDNMLAGKPATDDAKPGWTPEEIAELQRMENAGDKS